MYSHNLTLLALDTFSPHPYQLPESEYKCAWLLISAGAFTCNIMLFSIFLLLEKYSYCHKVDVFSPTASPIYQSFKCLVTTSFSISCYQSFQTLKPENLSIHCLFLYLMVAQSFQVPVHSLSYISAYFHQNHQSHDIRLHLILPIFSCGSDQRSISAVWIQLHDLKNWYFLTSSRSSSIAWWSFQ